MNIEEEIVYLSKLWYRYVGLDHHKDRDCHFYIQKIWSYGDAPYYQAHHYGYVASNFEGTKCDTLEEAQEELSKIEADNKIILPEGMDFMGMNDKAEE
jgi:ABC-type thiamine transport system substrate-binding protein